MRYSVQVNGELLTVDLPVPEGAVLTPVPGQPVWILTIGTTVHRVTVRRGASPGQYVLSLGGYRFEVEALNERARAIRDMARAATAASGPAPLRAPMPGLVTRLLVAAGDTVAAGQGLVVMEAMKMENELRSPSAGTVRSIAVAPGTAVEKGALLIELS
jgi:acetyl/propionyl-CoA carboxylase alpha subunit